MRPTLDPSRRLLVLGLGNVLCGDDGVGVLAVQQLNRRFGPQAQVSFIDGGTLGLSLLGLFEAGDDVLLVDAIGADAPAGSLIRLEADAVAAAMRERLSVHQVGVVDLLDALELTGRSPASLTLLGLVPETLELGLGLSPAVEAGLPRLIDAVAAAVWGAGHSLAVRGDDAERRGGHDDRALARVVGL